jgi:hypothetical protein
MPEFGEAAGPFIANLLRSLQEEAERLPSVLEALRESEPTPQQVGDFASKCVDVAAKAVADIVQGVREAAKTFNEPPPDFTVPDDLSDLQ